MEALLDSIGPLSPCADDSRRAEPRKKDKPVEHPVYKRFLARIGRVRWGDGYRGANAPGPDEVFFQASLGFCNELLCIFDDLCHSLFPDPPNGAVDEPDDHEDIAKVLPLVLDYVETETKRLLEDPELFPSEAYEVWFVWAMEWAVIFTYDAIEWADINYEGRSRRIRKMFRHERRRYLPNTDESRTPWQQFLHGRAPGAGIPKNFTSSEGCHQLLTRGGNLMLTNHVKDWNECGTTVQDYVASLSTDPPAPGVIKRFTPFDAKVAGHDPHEGFARSRRPVTHWATSTVSSSESQESTPAYVEKRPMPPELNTDCQDMSLRALSARYRKNASYFLPSNAKFMTAELAMERLAQFPQYGMGMIITDRAYPSED
ncbi:MAG: hypothetical protein Q9183_004524 [Haloplaca sp. 2 TL-2023]